MLKGIDAARTPNAVNASVMQKGVEHKFQAIAGIQGAIRHLISV
jgi:hypothetical protein